MCFVCELKYKKKRKAIIPIDDEQKLHRQGEELKEKLKSEHGHRILLFNQLYTATDEIIALNRSNELSKLTDSYVRPVPYNANVIQDVNTQSKEQSRTEILTSLVSKMNETTTRLHDVCKNFVKTELNIQPVDSMSSSVHSNDVIELDSPKTPSLAKSLTTLVEDTDSILNVTLSGTLAYRSNECKRIRRYCSLHFNDIISVRSRGVSTLIITFRNVLLAQKFALFLKETYNTNVTVDSPAPRQPQIKVANIPNGLSVNELLHCLVHQNTAFWNAAPNILKMYTVMRDNRIYTNAIISTDLDTHDQILALGKLNVGDAYAFCYEHTDLIQCMNCNRYGHSRNVCQYRTTCKKCGEFHSHTECKQKQRKCFNCLLSNENGSSFDPNHTAHYEKCPCRQRRLSIILDRLNAKNTKNMKTKNQAYKEMPTLRLQCTHII